MYKRRRKKTTVGLITYITIFIPEIWQSFRVGKNLIEKNLRNLNWGFCGLCKRRTRSITTESWTITGLLKNVSRGFICRFCDFNAFFKNEKHYDTVRLHSEVKADARFWLICIDQFSSLLFSRYRSFADK